MANKHLLITTLMRLKGEAPTGIDAGTVFVTHQLQSEAFLLPSTWLLAQALYPPEIQL